jgi:hypothetical protein
LIFKFVIFGGQTPVRHVKRTSGVGLGFALPKVRGKKFWANPGQASW